MAPEREENGPDHRMTTAAVGPCACLHRARYPCFNVHLIVLGVNKVFICIGVAFIVAEKA